MSLMVYVVMVHLSAELDSLLGSVTLYWCLNDGLLALVKCWLGKNNGQS